MHIVTISNLIGGMRQPMEFGNVRKVNLPFRTYRPLPWRFRRRQDLIVDNKAAIVTPCGTTSYRHTLSLSRGLCKLPMDFYTSLSVGSLPRYGRGRGGGNMGGSALTEADTATCPIPPACWEPMGTKRRTSESSKAPVATRFDFIANLHEVK
jgi:hypothetical protein